MWGRWWWWREIYQKRSGFSIAAAWSVNRFGSSLKVNDGEASRRRKFHMKNCFQNKKLNSHNNGSPIRLASHHKKTKDDDDDDVSTQVHIYRTAAVMRWTFLLHLFVSTLFYFIYWFLTSSSKRRWLRLLFPLFFFVRLSAYLSLASSHMMNLLKDLHRTAQSDEEETNINFMLRSHLKCALYHPPTLQFNPSCADVSPFTVTTCSCCVLLPKKTKKKKRNETRRRSEEKRRKRANRHNRWNL